VIHISLVDFRAGGHIDSETKGAQESSMWTLRQREWSPAYGLGDKGSTIAPDMDLKTKLREY
jgi:hypothetical protein